MSSTDELRRMLDERGIHWWSDEDDRKTLWESNDLTWEYFNNENGDAWLGFLCACEQDISPEQAIAATLGDAFTREECEASFVRGYSLGTLPVGSDPQWDENRQTVDEHMAELGWVRERTCRIENIKGEWFCSCCGEVVASDDPWCELFTNGNAIEELWNHCPSCGAKVVKR